MMWIGINYHMVRFSIYLMRKRPALSLNGWWLSCHLLATKSFEPTSPINLIFSIQVSNFSVMFLKSALSPNHPCSFSHPPSLSPSLNFSISNFTPWTAFFFFFAFSLFIFLFYFNCLIYRYWNFSILVPRVVMETTDCR